MTLASLRRRWTRLMGVFALLLWGMTLSSTARADVGAPQGWARASATETIQRGRMQLRYEPALSDEAMKLADTAPLWWSQVERELAGDVDDDLTVVFVRHAGQVAAATGMPTWAAGVAHPPRGEIVIAQHGPDGARTNIEDLLKHEMAHVVLHRATRGVPLPRWFHEGVADSFTGALSFRRAETLAAAVFGPGVPDLERLEGWFHGHDDIEAATAYAAARDLVTHLRYRDGNGSDFRQLLGGLASGLTLDAAFVRAYNRSVNELVSEWRGGLVGRFMWYALVTGGGLPFALVVPLVGWAWVRRRRVLRLAWRRLEQEDELARAHLDLVMGRAMGRA